MEFNNANLLSAFGLRYFFPLQKLKIAERFIEKGLADEALAVLNKIPPSIADNLGVVQMEIANAHLLLSLTKWHGSVIHLERADEKYDIARKLGINYREKEIEYSFNRGISSYNRQFYEDSADHFRQAAFLLDRQMTLKTSSKANLKSILSLNKKLFTSQLFMTKALDEGKRFDGYGKMGINELSKISPLDLTETPIMYSIKFNILYGQAEASADNIINQLPLSTTLLNRYIDARLFTAGILMAEQMKMKKNEMIKLINANKINTAFQSLHMPGQ